MYDLQLITPKKYQFLDILTHTNYITTCISGILSGTIFHVDFFEKNFAKIYKKS